MGRADVPDRAVEPRPRRLGRPGLLVLVVAGIALLGGALPTSGLLGPPNAGAPAATGSAPGSPGLSGPAIATTASPGPPPAADGALPLFASGAANSTPVPETGTYLGTISIGESPRGIAVDPSNGWVFVANFGGGTVSILNGSNPIGAVTVGTDPFDVAFDPYNGWTYVSNYGAGTVSVLDGASVEATVTVGTDPEGIAVDPGTGLAYIADAGSNTVTIVDGTTVSATVKVGSSPDGMAYSDANGDVYVADNGNANVTVLNGSSVVANISVGPSPGGIGYNPVTGYIYVTELGASAADVIYLTSVIRNVSVGSGPSSVAVDPANGLTYITNQGDNTVSIIRNWTVVSTVGGGNEPQGAAYDPLDGMVYVSDYDADTIAEISTLLGEAPPSASEHNLAIAASDVNQTINITADLWAVGSAGIGVTDHVAPSPGFGCQSHANISKFADFDLLSITCTPTLQGTYTIWLNATDSDHSAVWGRITIPVDPALVVPPPTISVVYVDGLADADVNQTVRFTANPSGGSGVYTAYLWHGTAGANCTGSTTAHLTCVFPIAGTYAISAEVNDSNAGTTYGSPSVLNVYNDPMAPVPVANHTAADVLEAVGFVETAYGGPPAPYTYSWSGFPAGACTGLTSNSPDCAFTVPGTINISVTVTDAVGVRAKSPTLAYSIDALPTVADPTSDRGTLDVGQSVTFSSSVSGASTATTFSWQGLPSSGCVGTNTSSPKCVAASPGTWTVLPIVTDANGGVAMASDPLSIIVDNDPSVGTPRLSASSITSGASVTITANGAGGSGLYTYNWSGLPSGCASRTDEVTCAPTATGTFAITVMVTDSNGLSSTSNPANLTVKASVGSTVLGSPGLIIVVVVVVVLAAMALLLMRRRRSSPPAADFERLPPEPMPEELPEEAPMTEEAPVGAPETFEDAGDPAP